MSRTAPRPAAHDRDELICYCFGYRRGNIEDEIRATGCTAIPEQVAAEVKAGNCACEVNNPSGKCCLGDLRRAIREISATAGGDCVED